MSKFKIGDRVVLINAIPIGEDDVIPVGSTATVLENDDTSFITFDNTDYNDSFFLDEPANCTYEGNLEFEEIYNTPLYKVMSEID